MATNNSSITMSSSREFSEDEFGKDMQIKLLKEKLEFVNNQLEEKDKQLDHYKQLCKTLKDLVTELSSRNRSPNNGIGTSPPSNTITQSSSSSSSSTGYHPANPITQSQSKDGMKTRPPPGFETKKNSIKGRKTKSFHAIRDSLEDDGMEDPTENSNENSWRTHDSSSTRRSDDLKWRKPGLQLPTSPITHSVSNPNTPTGLARSSSGDMVETFSLLNTSDPHPYLPSNSTNHSPANPVTRTASSSANPNSRLKKSVSSNAIASNWQDQPHQQSNKTPQEKDRDREREAIDRIMEGNSNSLVSPRGSSNPFSGSFTSPLKPPVSPNYPPGISHVGISASASAMVSSNSNLDSKKMSKLKKSQSMNSVYTVLEENRLDLKFPELDQLIGQIYPLSKYQQGCRFLQKKLDEKIPENTAIILNELFDHLVELLTDPFGNYLFSKLMEHCDSDQRDKIVLRILPEILNIAFDMYGTQSLQKMMPFLTDIQIDSVVNTLKQSAIALIKHNKANYLIQYCLDHLSARHNQWIYDAVGQNMEEIARDRVGCVIVKRCIDHATDDQRAGLNDYIAIKALALVQDPFGNYVVQHVLERYPTEPASTKMIRNLLGSINELCVQKFSSNVVEKCLQVSDPETRSMMLDEIIESDMLPQLLNDRFANFVIQTALDVAMGEQRQMLVKNILPHLGRHYSPYTKRLQKKILQVQ